MSRRLPGLRTRFGASMLGVGLGITLVLDTIASHFLDAAMLHGLQREADVYASVLARQINLAGSNEEIERLVYAVGSNRDVHTLIVTDAAGDRVLGATRRLLIGRSPGEADEPLLPARTPPPRQHALEADRRSFAATLPVTWTNLNLTTLHDTPGAVFVRIDAAVALADTARAKQLALLGSLAATGLTVLTFLLSTRRHIERPLQAIERTMRARRDGDRAARPGPMPNAELATLGATLHELLDSLDRSEALQRVVVDVASDAIVTIDVHGTIRQWNPAAEQMLGIATRDAIGTSITRILPPPHAAAHAGYVQRYLDSGIPRILGFSREVVAVHADGSHVPVSLAINEARIGDERLFVGILRDMSDELAVRRDLQAAKDAADVAAAAKAAFLANMSHEIRTPLTAILGYTEELERELPPSERREAAEIVRRNGEHLLTIINDVLDLSKIDAGKMTVERVPTQVDAIAMDVIRLMQPRAKTKGLALELCLCSAMPVSVATDPTRVRQILINLVGNALKFTAQGSVIVTIEAFWREEKLQVSVVDTGIGIPADRLGSLFNAFVQADSSTTRRHGGTGLGLDISRRLARLLGGDLVAESLDGAGSRFTFTLATGPMQPAATGDRAAAVRVQSPRATVPQLHGRVLLADDGPDNQKLLRRILGDTGLEVTVVGDGAAAVTAATATDARFDVVLMDMQMPVLDGLAATMQLRERGFTPPIVALTANVMPEDRARALAAGCSHFATKPIDRRVLYATLQEALGQPPTA